MYWRCRYWYGQHLDRAADLLDQGGFNPGNAHSRHTGSRCFAGNVFTLALPASGTPAMANPTNLVAGDTLTFIVTQNATTAVTLTWGTAYKFSGTTPAVSTGLGKVDIFTCTSPAGTNCYMAGVTQNF